MAQSENEIDQRIETIRRFNRSYAQKIGIFSEKIFGSTLSLTELRVLHELSLHRQTTATALSRTLKLDGGYLSRILNKFEKEDFISRERSLKDARQRKLSLTARGKKAWAHASVKANENITAMIAPLDNEQQNVLLAAMATISMLLAMD